MSDSITAPPPPAYDPDAAMLGTGNRLALLNQGWKHTPKLNAESESVKNMTGSLLPDMLLRIGAQAAFGGSRLPRNKPVPHWHQRVNVSPQHAALENPGAPGPYDLSALLRDLQMQMRMTNNMPTYLQ